MNYKNLLQIKIISAVLLFCSLKTTAQTKVSGAVGNYTSGTKIPKAIFNTLPGVGVHVRDVAFEVKYNVTSYTLKLADGEGGIKQVTCQGSAFSPLARQYINDYTKPGDIISIENIRARDEGGREVKIPALLYYIE